MYDEDAKLGGMQRSGKWPLVRRKFLAGKRCAVCGGKKNLQAHHIRPFHMFPELELDPKNLLPLCEGNLVMNCHLIFGHFGNFARKFNINIKRIAAQWLPKITSKSLIQ